MKAKEKKKQLDFSKYLILQKQFSILQKEVIFGENEEGESIEDFLNELEWIIFDHIGNEKDKTTQLFEDLKSMLEEAQYKIIAKSKDFLTNKNTLL